MRAVSVIEAGIEGEIGAGVRAGIRAGMEVEIEASMEVGIEVVWCCVCAGRDVRDRGTNGSRDRGCVVLCCVLRQGRQG